MRPGPRREGAHGRRSCPKKLFICRFAGLPVWRLTCLPQVCQGKRPGFERMQKVADDTTQHCHRLAPQDRRPRRRPEGPRSGWPIPPIRSDLVGKADKLLAATQPARPIPPLYLFRD